MSFQGPGRVRRRAESSGIRQQVYHSLWHPRRAEHPVQRFAWGFWRSEWIRTLQGTCHQSWTLRRGYASLSRRQYFLISGKIVHGRIQRVVIRRDKYKEEDELKQPKSTKDKSGFICPTCKEVFPNFSYVTNNHMGTRDCRGWPSGVNVELDDGVIGFIRRKNLSDDPSIISELLDNMRRGQNLTCRVLEFNQEKCSLELSCKSSDLKKDENVSEEPNFDHGRREKDQQNLISAIDKNTVKTNFTKRVISHQSFHNVTHTDAEKMLSTMSQVTN